MHPADLAKVEYLQAVARRLSAAGHGARGTVATEAAKYLGVSKQTLYTQLKTVGFSTERKLRADKGDSRVSIVEARAVAAIMRSSRRATDKALLPTCDAIDIALANGHLAKRVSPATMSRVMRRENCHPAQLAQSTPHKSMGSEYPNHVWQLDASLCVLYYLKDGKARVLDERTYNARKPNELAKVKNQRVLRYALTDHYSGAVIARYYNVSGEDQRTLFEFLMWAMTKQPGRQMHGVPYMMVWDAGSANQSHAISNLLTALMIRHWAHIPGNPRAKGQVECLHNVIERKFEGRLTYYDTESIEQLNGHLDTWLRVFNGVHIHSRHGHARDAVWQTIRTDQLRICPEDERCRVLMQSKPEPRQVKGNLVVTFKPPGYERGTYEVAHVPGIRVGDVVQVAINPFRAPSIFVIGKDAEGATRYWECEASEFNFAGFDVTAPIWGESYAAHADTVVDTARKEANEAAYGVRDSREAMNKKIKGAVAFGGAIDPFKDLVEKAANVPEFIQRRGTELDMPNPVQLDTKPLSITAAVLDLSAYAPEHLVKQLYARLQAIYGDAVPQDDMPALAAALQRGELPPLPETHQPQAPRLFAVR